MKSGIFGIDDAADGVAGGVRTSGRVPAICREGDAFGKRPGKRCVDRLTNWAQRYRHLQRDDIFS